MSPAAALFPRLGVDKPGMVFKSPFPNVPPLPDQNIHDFIFNKDRIPAKDYIVHIDALTGEKRTRDEFLDRVGVAATALCQPRPEGPAMDGGRDIVGILSHNSLVSPSCSQDTRDGHGGTWEILILNCRTISPLCTHCSLSRSRLRFCQHMQQCIK